MKQRCVRHLTTAFLVGRPTRMPRKMMTRLMLVGVLSMMTISGPAAQASTPSASPHRWAAAAVQLKADPHTNPYDILRSCRLSKKIKGIKKIPLRRGNSRWGWYKILGRHNITNWAAVCTVTRYGHPVRINGAQYRAKVLARLRACKADGTQCRVVKQVVVIQGFDIKKIDKLTRRGIITTYCKGSTLCPSWVTPALNTKPARVNGMMAYELRTTS